MNFGFFREVELLVDSTKILAAIHAICIVIATLPFIEIAIRRIVIGIAAIAIVAYLIRFGYIFKNDDSVYLLYPVIVLIGDVIFIAWPYLPRPPSSPYQQASQPMNSAAEQASDRHDSRAPAQTIQRDRAFLQAQTKMPKTRFKCLPSSMPLQVASSPSGSF